MGLLFFLAGLFVGGLIALFIFHYIPEKEPHAMIVLATTTLPPQWSNRPRPLTYFINSRGRKIYYEQRNDPTNKKCKGVLFVNVGYIIH